MTDILFYHLERQPLERVLPQLLERTLEPAFADSEADPVAQIHTLLDRVLDNQRQRNCIGGCPMGNLASELSDVHEGFRQRLAEVFVAWRITMTEALRRGQAAGRLRPECNPEGAAYFIVAALEWLVPAPVEAVYQPFIASLAAFAGMALAWLAGSVGLLALSMRALPLGTAYTIWTGIGAVGTAVLGIYLFGESTAALRLACIGLIVAGIVGLKLVSPE